MEACLIASIFIALLSGTPGCASEATLLRESSEGGLVSYVFHTEGEVLASAGRREAFGLIAGKCPNGSRIVREGEITNISKAADRAWHGQIGMNRRWGVEFACQ